MPLFEKRNKCLVKQVPRHVLEKKRKTTFDLYLAAILSLRFTPSRDIEDKQVFIPRKDFSGVLRIGEADLGGVPSISVSFIFNKPSKTDLSGLMPLAGFSALCWVLVLDENFMFGALGLGIPGDDMLAFISLFVR